MSTDPEATITMPATFTGASDIGLPQPAVTAELPALDETGEALTQALTPVQDTETLPSVEAEPEMAATGREATPGTVMAAFPAVGDLPAVSLPAVDILSCGHCRAVFAPASLDAPRRRIAGEWVTAPWTAWERDRLLYQLWCLAAAAGWAHDAGRVLTCPACQQAEITHAARVHTLETRPGQSFPDIFASFDAWVAVFVAERDEAAADGRAA